MEKKSLPRVLTGISFLSAIFLLLTFIGCEKSKATMPNCGCNSDSSNRYATYKEFGGLPYEAWLNYKTDHNQNAWFIGVHITDSNYSNYGAILKICNLDLPIIKALTDTSTRKYPIPVQFAGRLKSLCPDENWGFTTLPETVLSYITIDSLIKK